MTRLLSWPVLLGLMLLVTISGASATQLSEDDTALQQLNVRRMTQDPVVLPIHPTLNVELWEGYSPSELPNVFLDKSRKIVSQGVETLNDQLDLFFTESFWGDQVDVDEDSGSTSLIRLYNLYEVRPRKNNVGLSVNLKLVLNNTNERLQFLLTSEEDEDQDSGLLEDNQPENDITTAIRFIFNEDNLWKTSFDNGIRWSGGPRAFTQLRLRYKREFTHWYSRFVQRLFWEYPKGQGYDVDWNLSRALSERLGISTNVDGIFLKDKGHWTGGHSWRLTQIYSANISMRYSMGFTAGNKKGWEIDNYFITYSWRKRIYRDFIFFEIRPGLDFPRDKDFVHHPSLYFSLDYLTF